MALHGHFTRMRRFSATAAGEIPGQGGENNLQCGDGVEQWQNFFDCGFKHSVVADCNIAKQVEFRANFDWKCQPAVSLSEAVAGASQ